MTTPQEAWEAAVDAMNEAQCESHEYPTNFMDMDIALRAAVKALSERGYRIVPDDPTPIMTRAAAKAMSPGKRPTEEWVSACEKHAYRYMAMLAAAPAFPPEETR